MQAKKKTPLAVDGLSAFTLAQVRPLPEPGAALGPRRGLAEGRRASGRRQLRRRQRAVRPARVCSSPQDGSRVLHRIAVMLRLAFAPSSHAKEELSMSSGMHAACIGY